MKQGLPMVSMRGVIWPGLLLCLMIACAIVSLSHGADGMWDVLNYHLYVPYAALHDRYLVDIAPAQLQTYLNPLLDFPFYAALSAFNDKPRLVAALMGSLQGFNLLAVTFIAWHCLGLLAYSTRFERIFLSIIALAIGATGAGTVPLIGGGTGDLLVAIPVLAGLCWLLIGIQTAHAEKRSAYAYILAAGLLGGLAVGAKPTTGVFALGMAASLLVLPRALLIKGIAALALGGFIGALITGGPHMLHMVQLFGNPLFPLMNGTFHSPWWQDISVATPAYSPKTLFGWLFYPFEWASERQQPIVSELPFRDMRMALVCVLGALAIIVWVGRRVVTRTARPTVPAGIRALIIFGLVAYFAWLKVFAIYRYVLPLEMLSGVFVVLALGMLPFRALRLVTATAAAIVCYVTTVPLEWGHTPFGDRYVDVVGPKFAPDTLVLMVGWDPVAYVIPFLDRATWVSVYNNFLAPTQHNRLVARTRDIIAHHKGPLMVFNAGATSDTVRDKLAAVGLSPGGACQTISSNLVATTYQICQVTVNPTAAR